jgi:hypothetical protein
MIETPQSASPRCTATVDLLSRVFRPYNFLVTVTGEPPHQFVRRYRVAAPTDDEAAACGMQLFVKECMARNGVPAFVRKEIAAVAPRAKLQ